MAVLLQLYQEEEFLLARLRIGHTRLIPGHLLQDDPEHLCRHCGLRLTGSHARFECPQCDAERRTDKFVFLLVLA